MKSRSIAALIFLTGTIAIAQQTLATTTGLTVGGGSSHSCPVLVVGVGAGSPADTAGIKVGDVLIAINDRSVTKADDASKALQSDQEVPVILKMMRGENTYSKTVGRERFVTLLQKSHEKLLSMGMIAPEDATEVEMGNKIKSLSLERFAGRVFPSHYPTDERLYYAGFEVLTLKNPTQVVVLGIEKGPASRAGVHWGDTILAVNGVDPRGEPIAELEKMFSSDRPATMTLKIEREGIAKTYVFELEQATQVLRDNVSQMIHGVPMPAGIPEKYLPCFFANSKLSTAETH